MGTKQLVSIKPVNTSSSDSLSTHRVHITILAEQLNWSHAVILVDLRSLVVQRWILSRTPTFYVGHSHLLGYLEAFTARRIYIIYNNIQISKHIITNNHIYIYIYLYIFICYISILHLISFTDSPDFILFPV